MTDIMVKDLASGYYSGILGTENVVIFRIKVGHGMKWRYYDLMDFAIQHKDGSHCTYNAVNNFQSITSCSLLSREKFLALWQIHSGHKYEPTDGQD